MLLIGKRIVQLTKSIDRVGLNTDSAADSGIYDARCFRNCKNHCCEVVDQIRRSTAGRMGNNSSPKTDTIKKVQIISLEANGQLIA